MEKKYIDVNEIVVKNKKLTIGTVNLNSKELINPIQNVSQDYMGMNGEIQQKYKEIPRKIKNKNQYIHAQVFAQNENEKNIDMFQIQNVMINPISGYVERRHSKNDFEETNFFENQKNFKYSEFNLKGSSFISRISKTKMGQVRVNDVGQQDEVGQMNTLSVIQNTDEYSIYQNKDLNMDYTTQIKRNDSYISQQLKDLSKKSYVTVNCSSKLGKFKEQHGLDRPRQINKRGAIIRIGDIIKFGRVPILIRESNINKQRYNEIKDNHCGMPLFTRQSINETLQKLNQSAMSNSVMDLGCIEAPSPLLIGGQVNESVGNGNRDLYELRSGTSLNQSISPMMLPNRQRNGDVSPSQGLSRQEINAIGQARRNLAAGSNTPNVQGRNQMTDLAAFGSPQLEHRDRSNSFAQQSKPWNNLNQSTTLGVIQENPKMQYLAKPVVRHQSVSNLFTGPNLEIKPQSPKEKRTCRICLDYDLKKESDPVVSPCSCKGSGGDIHIKCLQEWLNQKRKVQKLSKFQENYIYKKSKCEVCNSLYPDMIEVRGKLYPIFDFVRPKKQNYLIFEILGMPIGKNFSIVKIPNNYSLEVGRNQTEIIIPDVSVSKQQSTIKFDTSVGEIVIQDSNSKYGTHLLIQRPIKLNLNQPMYFINGQSLICLTLKKEVNMFKNMCECFRQSSKKYKEQNLSLYEDFKYKMPHDLMRYKAEFPKLEQFFDTTKFGNNSLHLMPLQEHFWYTKQQIQQSELDFEEEWDIKKATIETQKQIKEDIDEENNNVGELFEDGQVNEANIALGIPQSPSEDSSSSDDE